LQKNNLRLIFAAGFSLVLVGTILIILIYQFILN